MNASDMLANESWQRCGAPAVSVVISLYNYAAFIEACLDSLQASETDGLPGGFEVVVVDDASTDHSAALVEKFMASHPLPLRLVKKKLNSGACDTRNLGLQTARAPLVFMLDADNVIRPQCLRTHYQILMASDCAFAYGIINRFDHATRKSLGTLSDHDWNVRELVARPYIDTMALFRKETVLRLGGYSDEYGTTLPSVCEDYDLYLKLAQAGFAGKFIPQVLSDYRVHPGSMVRTSPPCQHKLSVHLSRKFFPLVRAHVDLPTYFGISREELAITGETAMNWRFKPEPRSRRLIHRLLGEKMCRSFCKRLATVYDWLQP